MMNSEAKQTALNNRSSKPLYVWCSFLSSFSSSVGGIMLSSKQQLTISVPDLQPHYCEWGLDHN